MDTSKQAGMESSPEEEFDGEAAAAFFDESDWTEDEYDAADEEWGLEDSPDGAVNQRAAETFTLKHLGEEITVDRDEMVRLAQKGRDYDRIRQRVETLSERIRESEEYSRTLQHVAAQSGMTAEQYIDRMAAETRARETGIPLNEAERQVRAERAQKSAPVSPVVTAELVRDRETAEFMREYGGVSPADIPREVWAEVSAGRSLLDAYRSYENRQLNRQLAEARRLDANARRTMGSRVSAGNDSVRGEIEHDWYAED